MAEDGFFRTFLNSCTSLQFYQDLYNKSFFFSVKYVFKLACISLFLLGAGFTFPFISVNITGVVEDFFSFFPEDLEIYISQDDISTNQPTPFFLEFPVPITKYDETLSSYVTLDYMVVFHDDDALGKNFEKVETLDTLAVVTQTKLFVFSFRGYWDVYNISDVLGNFFSAYNSDYTRYAAAPLMIGWDGMDDGDQYIPNNVANETDVVIKGHLLVITRSDVDRFVRKFTRHPVIHYRLWAFIVPGLLLALLSPLLAIFFNTYLFVVTFITYILACLFFSSRHLGFFKVMQYNMHVMSATLFFSIMFATDRVFLLHLVTALVLFYRLPRL
eukprot:Colp12_sorted_trinity150504_noHs@20588